MADLDDLLAKTSRTFALTIPLLPEPTRERVGVAYLLFRIADTLEDAACWSRDRRLAALEEFAASLATDGAAGARWAAARPVDHEGYLELLRETPFVVSRLRAMPTRAREIVTRDLLRTAGGMADVVRRGETRGQLRLAGLAELRRYCYVVAGIVGEMLSDLYVHDWPVLAPAAGSLRRRAPFFGEGLQLVNILKDADRDLREGRRYLPDGTARSAIFALARRDLAVACGYVAALERLRAPEGLVAFNALPVLLATASLERVESEGPGAKLTRLEVAGIAGGMAARIASGRPAV